VTDWQWDETLYEGAAEYYQAGRVPYPAAIAEALRTELGLDGTGRLLDVGCGPGSLTVLLAPHFAEATGIDGSADMIAAARTRSSAVDWRVMRAEDITLALGRFRVVTFAQSFHWLDRPKVARRVRVILEPDGACVLVYAMTHGGVGGADQLPLPRPPRDEIDQLIAAYLGTTRRAGKGIRPDRDRPGDDTMLADDAVLAGAGFAGPACFTIGPGEVVERDEDAIVASVFSLSYAAPSLFGERKREFEQDLRALLRQASHGGRFCEELRETRLEVWRTRRSRT
jgi:SAM-dependent methyltransferase